MFDKVLDKPLMKTDVPSLFLWKRYKPWLRLSKGAIHLVSLQNFPKKYHFLTPGTHMYVWVSGGEKC